MVIDDEAKRADDAAEETQVSTGPDGPEDTDPERRRFLGNFSRAAMTAGLIGGYGGLGLIAGRYLYPARPSEKIWQYVTEVDGMTVGASRLFRSPSGESVNIVRQAGAGDATDFIALSSTCPHLGCQVHWESQNERYFCPCHNGTFDPTGAPTGGPPAEANQPLGRYPLRIQNGLLFIEVPATSLLNRTRRGLAASDEGCGISKPGHDRCLEPGNGFGGDKKT